MQSHWLGAVMQGNITIIRQAYPTIVPSQEEAYTIRMVEQNYQKHVQRHLLTIHDS